VRTSKKPYFIVGGKGALELKGVPIEKDHAINCHKFPLSIKSYLLAFVRQRLLQGDTKVELKKEISSRIFDAFKNESTDGRILPLFVLFYIRDDLEHIDWRGRFVKAKLSLLGMPYIDTRKTLLEYAKQQHVDLSAFYNLGDGHHNNLGNEVISKGIMEHLENMQLVGSGPSFNFTMSRDQQKAGFN
jgi:hypothetical protein